MDKSKIDNLTATDRGKISGMFDSIAGKYDFLNHFLSFGIDRSWRKKLIRTIAENKPQKILDVATGTGDLAIAAVKIDAKEIVGVDISQKMLDVGIKKIEKKGLKSIIDLKLAAAEDLPFDASTFDAAMVAFGVRNFEDLEKGMNEILRVLKPGGKLAVLEFSTPKRFPVKQFYKWYSFKLLPFLGKIISGDASAYTYLPYSVSKFPEGKAFCDILEKCGYQKIKHTSLSMNIVTLYSATK